MVKRIDVRGLSCPQPVIMVHRKMRKIGTGTFAVIGDDDTARENIRRLARDKDWTIKEKEAGEDFILLLSKA
ncbi:MAG: sulfurtransferase TusA family protein [Thermoplasmata archaeon]|nr:sulfurtransferase TusA family protein [Thermoplasmata archaeon]